MSEFTYELIKPTNTVVLCNSKKQVGVLDFNGPVMTFEGDADESAKVFFDFVAERFAQRLSEKREWVGLTDVEWMNIVNKHSAWVTFPPDEVAHEVAKLVEAKLKEKNA